MALTGYRSMCLKPATHACSSTTLVSQHKRLDLSIVFMPFLPSLRVWNSKSITENLPDCFQWHTLALRVEEDDKKPSEEANAGVEPKRPTRSPAFHHGEERRGNDDVRTPTGHSILSTWSGYACQRVTKGRHGLTSMVPTARTSSGINSVPIHAIVATPDEKQAT